MLLGASGDPDVRRAGVAVLLYFRSPWFREQDGFLFWVLAAYLYMLAVEIMLIVRDPQGQTPTGEQPRG